MSLLLSLTTNRLGFERYRVAGKCCSRRAYVHNLVKWPERQSDHKISYNVEIMCGGYNSKTVHDCAEHLNGRSAPIWCICRMPI